MTYARLTISALLLLAAAPAAAVPPDFGPAPLGEPRGYVLEPPREMPRRSTPAAAPAATWDPLRFAFGGQLQLLFPQGEAYRRLWGGRETTGGGLWLGGELLRARNRITLDLDLGWAITEATQTQSGSALSQKFTSNVLTLGASLRYGMLPWLAPYLRVAGGLGWDNIKISGSDALADQHMYSLGMVGGGIHLRTPTFRFFQGNSGGFQPRMGIMGRVEGGYVFAQNSDIVLRSSFPTASPSPVATSDVAIGKVARSAPYMRITVGVAF